MKKTLKSKKGFSLVEMVAVVAIILILASVALYAYLTVVRDLPWEEVIGENPFGTTTTETN